MEIKEALKSSILKEFITPEYLDPKILLSVKNAFKKNIPKGVQLQQLFREDKFNILKKEVTNLKFAKDYVPNTHSYESSPIGNEFSRLLESVEFRSFIEFITEKPVNHFESSAKRFSHGSYTLLSDKPERSSLQLNFFFANEWKEEFGGYHSYILKNDEALRLTPLDNSLTLVHMQNNCKSFVKYVNVNASNAKYTAVQSQIQ